MYESASVYFQPSTWESQGLAVLEAMSFDLPCVVSNRGGLPESVVNGQTGFVVEIDTADKAVQALSALLSDAQLRKQMGVLGGKRVVEQYSKECWYSRMDKLLWISRILPYSG